MEKHILDNKFRPFNLILFAIIGILAAGIIGGLTNFIDASISEKFFRINLEMKSIKDVPRASIAVGLTQGLITGVFFSLGFVIFIGIISKGACRFFFGLKYLAMIILGTLFFWLLAGLIGMGIGALSPEYILNEVNDKKEVLVEADVSSYVFVWGAIAGVNFGGFISVILGILIFRLRWKRLKSEAQT